VRTAADPARCVRATATAGVHYSSERLSVCLSYSSKCNGEQLRYFCVVSSLQWLFSGTITFFCVLRSVQRLFFVRVNVFLDNYIHSLFCGIVTNVTLLQTSSDYCSNTFLLIHIVINIFLLIQGKVSLFLLPFIKVILYTLLLLLVQHTTTN
jgi:hypothetical protein